MRQATSVTFPRRFSLKTMVAIALTAIFAMFADVATAADARYSAVVIDANTGKTLFSADAGGRRYPASLTKMMTLYITFEALAAGKISKNTLIPFSVQAASMPPTKLGVKAGNSITVDTAILSLVTKSANDSAAALGEYFGGSEAGFARMMTAKARSIGMIGTVFRNANGLPNPAQFTTARDMATLGIALREHFPQYYPYFSTRSFAYGRQRLANHNRLLGRIKGVDGIKTGYTRASGFNLVSSVTDGNRRIVAVVMGGTSGGARDAHMAQLIARYMPLASGRRGGPLVAKTGKSNLLAMARALLPQDTTPPPPGDAVDAEEVQEQLEVAAAKAPARPAAETTPFEIIKQHGYAAPAPRPTADIDAVNTASVATRSARQPVLERSSGQQGGWVVQIASSPSKAEAASALKTASQKAAGILAAADGFTTAFEKDGVTYYRARFGGFGSKAEAWKACASLKRKSIGCYAVQN